MWLISERHKAGQIITCVSDCQTHTHTHTPRETFLSLKPVYSRATAARVYTKPTPASGHHFRGRKRPEQSQSLINSEKVKNTTRADEVSLDANKHATGSCLWSGGSHRWHACAAALPVAGSRPSWRWCGALHTNKEKVMKEGLRLPEALHEPMVEPNDARPDFLEWEAQ